MSEKVCSRCRRAKRLDAFALSRATKDGHANRCRPCNVEYLADWRSRNPDAFKQWRAQHLGERAAYFAEWSASNRDRRRQYMAEWSRNNRDSINERVARRVALKAQAIPPWADLQAIRAVYARAAELTTLTGVPHEVDHFYPLQSKVVCGLHTEANLQILTQAENISKLNRMPEDWAGLRQAKRNQTVAA